MSFQASFQGAVKLWGGGGQDQSAPSGFVQQSQSVAVGFQAAPLNAGDFNTCVGYEAGSSSRTGSCNVLLGFKCAEAFAGDANVVVGCYAGSALDMGSGNTMFGTQAGASCAGGGSNVLLGSGADIGASSGSRNVACGSMACAGGQAAVAVGAGARAAGDTSIAVGAGARCTGAGAVVLGAGLLAPPGPGALNVAGRLLGAFDTGQASAKYALTLQSDALLVTGTATLQRGLQLSRPAGGGPWWRLSVMDVQGAPFARADLVLRSAGGASVTFTDDFQPGLFDFTAQHRCMWAGHSPLPPEGSLERAEMVGMVVSSVGEYPGGALTIDSAVPAVTLSDSGARDVRVFGVIAGFETGCVREFRIGNLGFKTPAPEGRGAHVVVNAAGEGAVWVCDAGGRRIRNGDLLTTSPVPGYAMVQTRASRRRRRHGCVPDTTVRAWTLAKATCDCGFRVGEVPAGVVLREVLHAGRLYHAALIGCVYRA